MPLIVCEDCGRQVSDQALACPFCGRPQAPSARPREPLATRPIVVAPSPGVAAVLSVVIPGLGQIYRGKVGRGLLWLVGVLVGYGLLILPGIILHLACIFDAASSPANGAAAPTPVPLRSTIPVPAASRDRADDIADGAGDTGAVVWPEVNLRVAPDPFASVVTRLSQNTPVRILGGTQDWLRVSVPSEKVVGWVMDSAVAKSKADQP